MSRHIVYLNTVGVVGGGERILLAMVRQTRRLRPKWRISVVLCADGPLRSALESLGATVLVLPLPGAAAAVGDTHLRTATGKLAKLLRLARTAIVTGPALALYLRRLKRTLNALKPDVIHSNGLKTHLLLALARPQTPRVVWHLHDFYSQRPLIVRNIRRFTRRVSSAVAISAAVKADAAPLLGQVPITVILNPVDTAHFTLAEPPTNAVPTIGLVATFANWKGQDVFLQAAALVNCRAKFVIIGGPIYSTAGSQFTPSELENQAISLGLADRIEFRPFAADPRAAYHSLDIVVHASTRPEPFGLTIIEAMACGRPVIVAAAGGALELFTDGVTALGHTPGDATSLAAAITRLLDDPHLRTTLGANARRHVEQHFQEARFGDQLLSLYDSLP
jgi:glycosyltransferase involved in cell wall biosynthesis